MMNSPIVYFVIIVLNDRIGMPTKRKYNQLEFQLSDCRYTQQQLQ